MEIRNDHLRLGLVASALILSLSIGYYTVVFLPAERRAADARLAREQLFQKQLDCQEQYTKLRREFNNVIRVRYSGLLNTCMVTFVDENGKQQEGTIGSVISTPAHPVQ